MALLILAVMVMRGLLPTIVWVVIFNVFMCEALVRESFHFLVP